MASQTVDLVGLGGLSICFRLVHRHLGHVQSAGGVEDDRVEQVLAGVIDRLLADLNRAGRVLAEDGDVDLLAEDFQLLNSRGPLEVGGDEHRFATLLPQGQRGLAGGGRFALAPQSRRA
ncbi:MAG: hypothetical protein U0797_12790 [Gemmataceae bacterium]